MKSVTPRLQLVPLDDSADDSAGKEEGACRGGPPSPPEDRAGCLPATLVLPDPEPFTSRREH